MAAPATTIDTGATEIGSARGIVTAIETVIRIEASQFPVVLLDSRIRPARARVIPIATGIRTAATRTPPSTRDTKTASRKAATTGRRTGRPMRSARAGTDREIADTTAATARKTSTRRI